MRHGNNQGRHRRSAPRRKSTILLDADAGPVELLAASPRRAAFMLDVSEREIYNLITDGQLESYLHGRNRKITISSLRAFIARRLESSRGLVGRRPGESMPRDDEQRAPVEALSGGER
jgi:hypothetical protein